MTATAPRPVQPAAEQDNYEQIISDIMRQVRSLPPAARTRLLHEMVDVSSAPLPAPAVIEETKEERIRQAHADMERLWAMIPLDLQPLTPEDIRRQINEARDQKYAQYFSSEGVADNG